jgi:hypothetical protein
MPTGYTGMKRHEDKVPKDENIILLFNAVESLVELYDAWGKKDKANTWRQKLEEMKVPAKPATKPR